MADAARPCRADPCARPPDAAEPTPGGSAGLVADVAASVAGGSTGSDAPVTGACDAVPSAGVFGERGATVVAIDGGTAGDTALGGPGNGATAGTDATVSTTCWTTGPTALRTGETGLGGCVVGTAATTRVTGANGARSGDGLVVVVDGLRRRTSIGGTGTSGRGVCALATPATHDNTPTNAAVSAIANPNLDVRPAMLSPGALTPTRAFIPVELRDKRRRDLLFIRSDSRARTELLPTRSARGSARRVGMLCGWCDGRHVDSTDRPGALGRTPGRRENRSARSERVCREPGRSL